MVARVGAGIRGRYMKAVYLGGGGEGFVTPKYEIFDSMGLCVYRDRQSNETTNSNR